MDYSRVFEELKSATMFDLFRLYSAIGQQLEDPERIEQVRSRLRPGMEISFFLSDRNDLLKGTVLKLNRTRAEVLNHLDNRMWTIHYFAINLDDVDTEIRTDTNRGMSRIQLKIGDSVGFHDRQNQEKYGQIIALNQKTATILVNEREKWRVAYAYLFPVIESID
jgi:hypothetical protein